MRRSCRRWSRRSWRRCPRSVLLFSLLLDLFVMLVAAQHPDGKTDGCFADLPATLRVHLMFFLDLPAWAALRCTSRGFACLGRPFSLCLRVFSCCVIALQTLIRFGRCGWRASSLPPSARCRSRTGAHTLYACCSLVCCLFCTGFGVRFVSFTCRASPSCPANSLV